MQIYYTAHINVKWQDANR